MTLFFIVLMFLCVVLAVRLSRATQQRGNTLRQSDRQPRRPGVPAAEKVLESFTRYQHPALLSGIQAMQLPCIQTTIFFTGSKVNSVRCTTMLPDTPACRGPSSLKACNRPAAPQDFRHSLSSDQDDPAVLACGGQRPLAEARHSRHVRLQSCRCRHLRSRSRHEPLVS